jgi:hypothetical protein
VPSNVADTTDSDGGVETDAPTPDDGSVDAPKGPDDTSVDAVSDVSDTLPTTITAARIPPTSSTPAAGAATTT